MGRNGKWLDPNQLMSYTVTQALSLPDGAAVGLAAASPLVSQSGHKRSHDGNGVAHAKGKKLKRKDVSKRTGPNFSARSLALATKVGTSTLADILPLQLLALGMSNAIPIMGKLVARLAHKG